MPNESAKKHLSIVIPAYNEEQRIAGTLARIAEYMERQSYSFEVLVVDDGSTDRTSMACEEFAAHHPWCRLIRLPRNRGKGFAVRTGVLEAAGEYILMCDADLATPIEELDGFWALIEDKADIVIASRPLRESKLVKRQPLYREWAGRALNTLVRAIAVPGIHDTQCGFKMFTRRSARCIFPYCTLDRFSFDIEVLHLARRMGFQIREAPVHWYHVPGSKIRFLRDGLGMIVDLLRIRLRHRKLPECRHEI